MTNTKTVLLDHVDMRLVTAAGEGDVNDRNALVELDPDHPGFRDPEYRAMQNGELRKLIRLLREAAPITQLQRVNFLRRA